MNVHISYKTAKAPDLEKEFNNHIAKLSKRLQVFRPELVHLKGIIEQNSGRQGVVVSLNLRLPSGQMASQKAGTTAIAAIKTAFNDLVSQLTRHKDLLRVQQRRRFLRRSVREVSLPSVPFEKTTAAVHPPMASAEDVKSYVNANLARLERFVERELRFRETNGLLQPNLMNQQEVVDEAIAMALGDEEEKPELLSLERWLYRLAIQAINRLATNGEAITAVPLETSARKQNVRASDEPQLQYHQPDEMLLQAEVIPDRRMATPEDVAASDEMIDIVESALKGSKREEREAFILYAIEGFTLREISAVSDRPEKLVRAAIEAARQQLQKTLPVSHWREKLLQHSKTA